MCWTEALPLAVNLAVTNGRRDPEPRSPMRIDPIVISPPFITTLIDASA